MHLEAGAGQKNRLASLNSSIIASMTGGCLQHCKMFCKGLGIGLFLQYVANVAHFEVSLLQMTPRLPFHQIHLNLSGKKFLALQF